MAESKIIFTEQLLKMIEIHNRIIKESEHLDNKTRDAFFYIADYWVDRIRKESFSVTVMKSIANDILTYWRESVSIDTELFWIELNKNNINFERKDELNFALNKGRFRRVDIGMGARRDWDIIKEFKSIKERFTLDEIEKIDRIIEKDEKNRLGILQKCLNKKSIPETQHRKFYESFAYFSYCCIFDKYFSKEEIVELNNL